MADSTDGPESGTPTRPVQTNSTPVVGIGASAGGVEALEAFFDGLPPTPDMAFVVVPHLSPDHESNFVPILERHTDLAVAEITDGAVPEANTVAVLPARSRLRIADGQFRLDERAIESGPPSVIDTFFRSLADDHGEAAIGILLSGSGTDGTLGIRALKERGAFAMVQSPDDAAYSGMPRSALDTGLIDVVDDAEQLGATLPEYWTRATAPTPVPDKEVDAEDLLRKIFARLYAETGHNFSDYKRSTIRRRLQRRMAVQQAPTLSAYLEALQDPEEVQALFREFLISVTSFFRDPDHFDALATSVVPHLFEGKGRGDQVRVWAAGCASGEEAYSLAILLDEHARSLQAPPDIQIFGTDPSAQSIDWAREGRYPKSIAADLSDERLNRYFRPEGDHYRVIPPLREMVLFAEHDLLEDPPFSQLDLVTCRNVLIYLQRSIHARVLRFFHYGLRPDGYLFLGPSESPSGASELFESLTDLAALYRRKPATRDSAKTVPVPPASDLAAYQPAPASSPNDDAPPKDEAPPKDNASSPESLSDFHEQTLLDETASLLVNESGDVVHTTEPATSYLSYQGGTPSHNLLDAVPEALRLELRGALQTAFREDESTGPTVVAPRPSNDASQAYLLRVRPLDHDQHHDRLAQVRLEGIASRPQPTGDGAETTDAQRAEQLEAELVQTKEQLQNTIEEYETTTEELESSNEELLSMNEELKSKNEEIETSKEELQSVNEELKTTNQELEAKVRELEETNSDLRNLMQATTVATLFLDRDLRVEWFTPRVREQFNIRETDTGRPLSDLTTHVQYDTLLDDAQAVLDSLQESEREVRDHDGRWFLVRMRPYHTVDEEVDGVVVTFVDITGRKQAELEVREERNFVESLLDTVGALIVVLDTEHRIVRFNEKCEAVTGYSADEVMGESVFDRLVPQEEADEVRDLLDAPQEDPASNPHEHHWITREGNRRLIRWSNTTLAEDGTLQYIIGTGVDVTRRRQLEREVIGVSDRERQRIGQDLHDILASHLSGTAMMTKGLAQKIEDGREISAEEVEEISDLIQDAGEQARKLSHSLMPLEVHGDDLLEGFENLARRQEEITDVTCTFETQGSLPALDPDIISHLYRIASEAVNNAIKHGAPDRISIRLRMEDDRLSLIVQDDGVGIPDDVADEGTLGLNMMQYRADLIGARLDIDSGEDGGTVVSCSMPIAHSSDSSSSGEGHSRS